MSGDLRVVKTRRVIRNTLFEMMSEKPLSKITISEICARAEINRKTFYLSLIHISEPTRQYS